MRVMGGSDICDWLVDSVLVNRRPISKRDAALAHARLSHADTSACPIASIVASS